MLMAPPSQGNIYTSMGHPAVSGAMTIGKHCARLLNYLLKPLPFGVALALALWPSLREDSLKKTLK